MVELDKKTVTEYVIRKMNDKLYNTNYMINVITNDEKLYEIKYYQNLIIHDHKVPPARFFIINQWYHHDQRKWYNIPYNFPFLNIGLLASALLRKYYYFPDYFRNLKYMTIITHVKDQISVETIDLDEVENNIKLPTSDCEEEFEEILKNQKLFDRYNYYEAVEIIKRYYKLPENRIEVIKDAYQRIFNPYRIEL